MIILRLDPKMLYPLYFVPVLYVPMINRPGMRFTSKILFSLLESDVVPLVQRTVPVNVFRGCGGFW